MSNVLGDTTRQQILALGRLGWTLWRIEQSTGRLLARAAADWPLITDPFRDYRPDTIFGHWSLDPFQGAIEARVNRTAAAAERADGDTIMTLIVVQGAGSEHHLHFGALPDNTLALRERWAIEQQYQELKNEFGLNDRAYIALPVGLARSRNSRRSGGRKNIDSHTTMPRLAFSTCACLPELASAPTKFWHRWAVAAWERSTARATPG